MTLTTALSSRTARTTMAYTAAALSYLIQNNAKPVVITGSQKSIFNQDTDARENLRDAFLYACDDGACGVHIVFDHKVILGTRARKVRTKSYNAFSSIDYPETAILPRPAGRVLHPGAGRRRAEVLQPARPRRVRAQAHPRHRRRHF